VALPRLWVPIYADHAAWETPVAKVTRGLSLWPRAVDERLEQDVRVRTSSVLKWIRRYATTHGTKPEPTGNAMALELDEMWKLLKKNARSSGSGRLVIVLQASSWTGSAGVVITPPSHGSLIA
jgi:hypothetical protein